MYQVSYYDPLTMTSHNELKTDKTEAENYALILALCGCKVSVTERGA